MIEDIDIYSSIVRISESMQIPKSEKYVFFKILTEKSSVYA